MKEFDYFDEILSIDRGVTPNARVPIGRVIERLDDLLSRDDYTSAERHLSYWLIEAENLRDLRADFLISNELMGLYRKIGEKQKAYAFAERAVKLSSKPEIQDSSAEGTALLNAATVYKAFGEAARAAEFYERAEDVYNATLDPSDVKFAGLYNNYGLALVDLKRFAEAKIYYDKAIEILSHATDGEPEIAITELNVASLAEARDGLVEAEGKINACVERAAEKLNEAVKRDGNYAYVCEKCSAVFGYYGFFIYEAEYKKRAKEIYERT